MGKSNDTASTSQGSQGELFTWREMDELGEECDRLCRIMARLKGITQSSSPYEMPAAVEHLRRTVNGYRRAVITRLTEILAAISAVNLSKPECPENGKTEKSHRS